MADDNWLIVDTVLKRVFNGPLRSSQRVAAFDFDGTLVHPKGNNTHAKSGDDWKFVDPNVPTVLSALHEQGYCVVMLSNQKGIAQNNERRKIFEERVQRVASCLAFPVLVLASTEDDSYRKPRRGMWDLMETLLLYPVHVGESFFVGDAAGRPEVAASLKPKFKKDHSDSDRKFAINVKCKFFTPEGIFRPDLKQPELPPIIFNPRAYLEDNHGTIALDVFEDGQWLIITVGSPGSGKSTFVRRRFPPDKFTYVSRDDLKTRNKCLKVCQGALNEGENVVIDNTNADVATRKLYLDMARKFANVRTKCLYFTAGWDLCLHNNALRDKKVPTVALRMYWSRFEEPTKGEGFDVIQKVDFVPNFENEEAERKWSMFYV